MTCDLFFNENNASYQLVPYIYLLDQNQNDFIKYMCTYKESDLVRLVHKRHMATRYKQNINKILNKK